MKKAKVFDSMSDYLTWADSFDGSYDYQMIPSVVIDSKGYRIDLMTECKSWKTAIKRFRKAFASESISASVSDWCDMIAESCENGCWSDAVKPSWFHTKEEYEDYIRNGSYSWGVEQVDDGLWYIYLNASGCHAR